jgi:hypothetical protein
MLIWHQADRVRVRAGSTGVAGAHMAIWRITYPPSCGERVVLLEDVEADELENRDGVRLLVRYVVVVLSARGIVVRRVPAGARVDRLCRHRRADSRSTGAKQS